MVLTAWFFGTYGLTRISRINSNITSKITYKVIRTFSWYWRFICKIRFMEYHFTYHCLLLFWTFTAISGYVLNFSKNTLFFQNRAMKTFLFRKLLKISISREILRSFRKSKVFMALFWKKSVLWKLRTLRN